MVRLEHGRCGFWSRGSRFSNVLFRSLGITAIELATGNFIPSNLLPLPPSPMCPLTKLENSHEFYHPETSFIFKAIVQSLLQCRGASSSRLTPDARPIPHPQEPPSSSRRNIFETISRLSLLILKLSTSSVHPTALPKPSPAFPNASCITIASKM
jgi:hypothetical protein